MMYIQADSLKEAYKKTFFALLLQKRYDDPEIYKEDVAIIEIITNKNDNLKIFNSKFILKNNYIELFPYITNQFINKELLYWENSLIKKNNLNKIINYLKNDKLTKRAIILFWNDKYRNTNGKSICEIASFFRKKGKYLDMHTMMRANNASFLLYMDMDVLTSIHKIVADALKLKPGKYLHFINSLHFYKKEINIIKKQYKLLKTINL